MARIAQGFGRKKYNCPAEMALDLIGGKWRAILLYNLRKAPLRFGALKRFSPGISSASLSKELRALERAGIVHRQALGRDSLAGVEYSLTPTGESLKPALYALIRWGLAHQKQYVEGDFGMMVFQK